MPNGNKLPIGPDEDGIPEIDPAFWEDGEKGEEDADPATMKEILEDYKEIFPDDDFPDTDEEGP